MYSNHHFTWNDARDQRWTLQVLLSNHSCTFVHWTHQENWLSAKKIFSCFCTDDVYMYVFVHVDLIPIVIMIVKEAYVGWTSYLICSSPLPHQPPSLPNPLPPQPSLPNPPSHLVSKRSLLRLVSVNRGQKSETL